MMFNMSYGITQHVQLFIYLLMVMQVITLNAVVQQSHMVKVQYTIMVDEMCDGMFGQVISSIHYCRAFIFPWAVRIIKHVSSYHVSYCVIM